MLTYQKENRKMVGNLMTELKKNVFSSTHLV